MKQVFMLLLLFAIINSGCDDTSANNKGFKDVTGNWSGKGLYYNTISIELDLNLSCEGGNISQSPGTKNTCIVGLLYKNETNKYTCYSFGTITGNAVELSFGSTLGTSTYSGIVNETLDTISGVFLARNMGSVGVSDCEVELELVKSKF